MITLEIDSTTQYATAYDGDKPVATLQRRRVYEKGPVWKAFDTNGELMFTANATQPRLFAQRIARILANRAAGIVGA